MKSKNNGGHLSLHKTDGKMMPLSPVFSFHIHTHTHTDLRIIEKKANFGKLLWLSPHEHPCHQLDKMYQYIYWLIINLSLPLYKIFSKTVIIHHRLKIYLCSFQDLKYINGIFRGHKCQAVNKRTIGANVCMTVLTNAYLSLSHTHTLSGDVQLAKHISKIPCYLLLLDGSTWQLDAGYCTMNLFPIGGW